MSRGIKLRFVRWPCIICFANVDVGIIFWRDLYRMRWNCGDFLNFWIKDIRNRVSLIDLWFMSLEEKVLCHERISEISQMQKFIYLGCYLNDFKVILLKGTTEIFASTKGNFLTHKIKVRKIITSRYLKYFLSLKNQFKIFFLNSRSKFFQIFFKIKKSPKKGHFFNFFKNVSIFWK